MSHDLYASWASSEISNIIESNPQLFFDDTSSLVNLSAYAGKDVGSIWPIADGVINIGINGKIKYMCAVELKRENEGIHGILTALGQSIAYLEKGYQGSFIIIPQKYATHSSPGDHLNSIINLSLPNLPIGIICYDSPDTSSATPFRNKISIIRKIQLDKNSVTTSTTSTKGKISTQWAHIREGCYEVDSFFRYLQISKQLDCNNLSSPIETFPQELINAVKSISSEDIISFLSYTPNNSFSDYVWRYFWFKFILIDSMRPLFIKDSTGFYYVNHVQSKILQNDNCNFKKFFSGRSDSIKEKLVNRLNNKEITEDQAYIEYVKNIRDRAHSYREDIDSTLEHIGLLSNDGKPTSKAYKFIDACERSNDSHTGTALSILTDCVINNGNLGSLLYYINRLSEDKYLGECR